MYILYNDIHLHICVFLKGIVFCFIHTRLFSNQKSKTLMCLIIAIEFQYLIEILNERVFHYSCCAQFNRTFIVLCEQF